MLMEMPSRARREARIRSRSSDWPSAGGIGRRMRTASGASGCGGRGSWAPRGEPRRSRSAERSWGFTSTALEPDLARASQVHINQRIEQPDPLAPQPEHVLVALPTLLQLVLLQLLVYQSDPVL